MFVDQARITTPLASLTALAGDLDAFVNATLAPLLADTTANRAPDHRNVDSFLAKAVELLERAARLALPSSGWGFAVLRGCRRHLPICLRRWTTWFSAGRRSSATSIPPSTPTMHSRLTRPTQFAWTR